VYSRVQGSGGRTSSPPGFTSPPSSSRFPEPSAYSSQLPALLCCARHLLFDYALPAKGEHAIEDPLEALPAVHHR